MSESIVRELDGWKIIATQRPDNSWLVEADDVRWARHEDVVGADLEQALCVMAPLIEQTAGDLLCSFGLR